MMLRVLVIVAALAVPVVATAATDQEKLGKLLSKSTVENAFDVQGAKVACVCRTGVLGNRVGILVRRLLSSELRWFVQCWVPQFAPSGAVNLAGLCDGEWELLTK